MNQIASAVSVSRARPEVLLRLALLQFAGTLAFSLALYFCFDVREAISALLGGLIAMFASGFSAWQLFRGGQNLKPENMLVRFYLTVVLKIAFTVALMAVCIVVLKVSMLPFIVAYLLSAVVINWLVLLLPQAQKT